VQLEKFFVKTCNGAVCLPWLINILRCAKCRPSFLSTKSERSRNACRGVYPSSDMAKWHETPVFLYTYRLPSANNPEKEPD
jgi:hypothetical protein